MKTIKLLDCTLRDGGYINDWNFGKEHIDRTISFLEKSGVDILEIGFIRDEPSNPDRTVFRSIEEITSLIPNKKQNIMYTAMAEATKPVPMEWILPRNESSVDAIRVIIWKDKHDSYGNIVDALHEGFDYCKGFVDKGYDLFVQPARVEQYSDEEFVAMLDLYSQLNPKAIYIVDSWGTMYPDEVLHYTKLADAHLRPGISLGFHGHNNLMQAFANAVDFIHLDTDRELILDSSVYGIGRGAGNLNSEIIAKYLNGKEGKSYNVRFFFEIYEDMVKELSRKYIWGYSPAYFMSAYHHANPQYATYYGCEHDLESTIINSILENMNAEDKVLYTAEKAGSMVNCSINTNRRAPARNDILMKNADQ